MKTFILTTTLSLTALLSGSDTAQAGQFYGNFGGNGYNQYSQSYNRYSLSQPSYGGDVHHNANPWVNPGAGHYDFHNTTHFDYQPARTVPHYNHFDYQPGRYVQHQTGHYDLHH